MVQALAQDILDSGRVSAFTAQGLTNVLWGFATLRYHPHAVLAAICEELHRRIHTLSAQVGPLGFAPASTRLSGSRGCTEPLVAMRCPRCCAHSMRSLCRQSCPAAPISWV